MPSLLLLTNFFLVAIVLFLGRRLLKIKKKYSRPAHPIPTLPLAALDPIFEPNELGTTLGTEVVFVGKGETPVIGAVSDTEGWGLAALAKKAKNIFEFGTCTGRTTYLLARNSPGEAKITTLTLPPQQKGEYRPGPQDEEGDTQNALTESGFEKFFYTNTAVEHKITQLYGDSKAFDETPYLNQCDLIFVDGSHAYSYVKNDSKKALRMIAPGGLILWHDYIGPENVKGVYQALNELAKELNLVHIEGTRLVAYRKNQ